jgi:hypothetical protein
MRDVELEKIKEYAVEVGYHAAIKNMLIPLLKK